MMLSLKKENTFIKNPKYLVHSVRQKWLMIYKNRISVGSIIRRNKALLVLGLLFVSACGSEIEDDLFKRHVYQGNTVEVKNLKSGKSFLSSLPMVLQI